MATASFTLLESDLALDPTAAGTDKAAALKALNGSLTSVTTLNLDDAGEITGTTTVISTTPGSQGYVRRPLRGIQLKKDVFAVLTVSGDAVLANSSARSGTNVAFTSNFLLQSVQESRAEKFQQVTTFGAAYGFFFGEQPRMVTCQAILLNTADFQWEAEWWTNYDEHMRGTRLVDKGARVSLTYEDVLVEGYMVAASTSKGEPNPWVVNLTFTLWVTGVTYLITPGEDHVDEFHSKGNAGGEWAEFDQDGTLDGPSMTEQVRSLNIQALSAGSGVGLVGAILNDITSGLAAFNSYVGAAGAMIGNATDWLYGRTLVVPAGFAGSEQNAGFATFASGSGSAVFTLSGDQVSITQGSITVRAPVRVGSQVPPKGNFYDDNVDEYPSRQSTLPAQTLLPPNPADPSQAYAEAMFANFGVDVLASTNPVDGEILRQMVGLSFAATALTIDVAADAASLIFASSSKGKVSAAQDQAAGQALS